MLRPFSLAPCLALFAALAGCHAESPQTGAPAATPAGEPAAEATAEAPPELPAVPAEYACRVDADCVLSQHPRAVVSTAECACPGCPQPLAREAAAAGEAAFRRHCAEWAVAEGCSAPFCPATGTPACLDGRCGVVLAPSGRHEAAAPAVAVEEQTIRLALGDRLWPAGEEVSVWFEDVSEDSRCPIDVECVWAGDAVVVLRVAAGGAEERHELHTLREPRSAPLPGLGRLVLEELAPLPRADGPPAKASYVATLRLEPEPPR